MNSASAALDRSINAAAKSKTTALNTRTAIKGGGAKGPSTPKGGSATPKSAGGGSTPKGARPTTPKSGGPSSRPGSGGTTTSKAPRGTVSKATSKSPTKLSDTTKPLSSEPLSEDELRARAKAWESAAIAEEKAAKAKMSLAAKLGAGITQMMIDRGMSLPRTLFAEWDLDGNGQIDRAEWRTACQKLAISGATEGGVDALFDRLDEDKSGEIDLDELVAGLEMLKADAANAANEQTSVINDMDVQKACALAATKAADAKRDADAAEVLAVKDAGSSTAKELRLRADDAKKLADGLMRALNEQEEEAREELAEAEAGRKAKAEAEAAMAAQAKEKEKSAAAAAPATKEVGLW